MKRIIAVVLMAVLVLSLVGCSSEDIGMYALLKEVDGLEAVETSGSANLSINGEALDTIFKGEEFKSLKDALKSQVEIKYLEKQKKSTCETEISFEIRANGEKDFKKFTTLIINKDTVYIKVDDLIKFLEPYVLASNPSSKDALDKITANIGFLKMDLNSNTLGTKGYDRQKIQKFAWNVLDIFKESFSDYSTGIVSKKNNGYELKLASKDVKSVIAKLFEYLSTNGDVVFNKASEKIEAMSDEDYAALIEPFANMPGFPIDEIKSKGKAALNLRLTGGEVKKDMATALDGMKNDKNFDEELKSIDGSEISYYIEKTAPDTYNAGSGIKIKYNGQCIIDLSENAIAKKVTDVTITKPTKVISVEDVKNMLPEELSEMRIRISNGDTSLKYSNDRSSDSKLNIVMKNNYTYLPLRAIGEMYGEKVGWDGRAYVEKDGSKVYMTGLNVNGRVYVKLRDFEQIGYSVWWDEDNGQAVIQKPKAGLLF